jgi:hypothetical protein
MCLSSGKPYQPQSNTPVEYEKRLQEMKRQEKENEEIREMLLDADLADRLFLFMRDVSELPSGSGFDKLPHFGKYVDAEETTRISRYCRLSDITASPEDILDSMEKVFPRIRTNTFRGTWHYKREDYVSWLRNGKVCIPGTLRGPQSAEILRIRLEEQQLEKEKKERVEQEEERKREINRRRKETREKRKLEKLETSSEGVDISSAESVCNPRPAKRARTVRKSRKSKQEICTQKL